MKWIKENKLLIIGISFITAIFVAIIGGLLIEQEVTNYLQTLRYDSNIVLVGGILESINVICVILIGFLMFDFFKENKAIGRTYVITRVLEASFSLLGIVFAFLMMNEYVSDYNLPSAAFKMYQDLRGIMLNGMVPLFFSLTAFILYYGLDKVKLVPKYLVIWGYVGAVGILLLNFTPIPESIGMLFALPIITNELYLGGYLIFKNFKLKTKEQS